MSGQPKKKKVVKGKKKKLVNENQPYKGPRRAATLEEPVYITLARDLKMIGWKLFHVLIPRVWSRDSKGVDALRDWDLWGPLLISLMLGICCTFLSKTNSQVGSSAIFAAAFSLPWLGAILIVLNSMLLGGTMSFFQAVSLIGYCIFPLALASLICNFWSNFIFRASVCLVGFLWGTLASVGFFAGLLPPNRKALGVYPVFLLFAILGWLILSL